MYDNIPWNQKELETIQAVLAIQHKWVGVRSLEEHRSIAMGRYNSHLEDSTTGEVLEIHSSGRFGADKYGSDLLVVRNLRHDYTNYSQFWADQPKDTAIQKITWLIGFLRVGRMMANRFPELADAIALETIKRVSVQDRALLRETVLTLAKQAKVEIPNVPYSELQAKAGGWLDKRLLGNDDAAALWEIGLGKDRDEQIRERIVQEFNDKTCDSLVIRLGSTILHRYHMAIVRERITRRALTALADYYPELNDVCQRRINKCGEMVDLRMDMVREDIPSPKEIQSSIYAPALNRVFLRTVKAYNELHRNGILDGREPNLYLTGATGAVLSAIRGLAIQNLLTYSSRYDEYIDIAGTMPEPMASIQKEKIRRLFLGKVQEHYPELTGAVQAELRLLNPEPKAVAAS